MFSLGLLSIWGIDAVGWMAKPTAWVAGQEGAFFKPSGKAYSGLGQWGSLGVTYLVWTTLVCIGAYFQRLNVARFWQGWTVLFLITYTATIIGHEAHLSAPVNKWESLGLSWGFSLGGDGTVYILCLAAGLIIGNFIKPLAAFVREACKPEWYIKTAIVYLGIKVGLMSMKAAGMTFELALAGVCATFVAYLLFWPIIYTIARRLFRLPREWAAVLCSGISICGVSAAIATGGAIRAKPIIAVMVSMLIVVYAMVELVVLPGFYTAVAPDQPIVNGAAMGMTVKTDGADAAAGAILDELMVNKAAAQGISWQKDWILTASIMTKIWIDMFIGVWAFVLAIIWVYKVDRAPGTASVGASEIWFRFPKFVIGYVFCWFFYVAIATFLPDIIEAAQKGANTVQSPMRKFMFYITFVAMGCITDFSKLRGMGRLAVLYGVALVVVIAPIAYFVAWVFHNGMMPPAVQ